MNNVYCNHADGNNGNNEEINSLCFFCKKCYALLCFSCRLTHPHKNDLILCNTDVKYSQINFSFISEDINSIYKNYCMFNTLFPYLSDITQSLSMLVASFLNCNNVFNNKFSCQKEADDLINKIPNFIENFRLNTYNNFMNMNDFKKHNNELVQIKEIGGTINEIFIEINNFYKETMPHLEKVLTYKSNKENENNNNNKQQIDGLLLKINTLEKDNSKLIAINEKLSGVMYQNRNNIKTSNMKFKNHSQPKQCIIQNNDNENIINNFVQPRMQNSVKHKFNEIIKTQPTETIKNKNDNYNYIINYSNDIPIISSLMSNVLVSYYVTPKCLNKFNYLSLKDFIKIPLNTFVANKMNCPQLNSSYYETDNKGSLAQVIQDQKVSQIIFGSQLYKKYQNIVAKKLRSNIVEFIIENIDILIQHEKFVNSIYKIILDNLNEKNKLKQLDLKKINLQDQDMYKIVTVLNYNKQINDLFFQNNLLTDSGMKIFFDDLSENNHIKNIFLNNNNITSKTIHLFKDCVVNRPKLFLHLKIFSITGNKINQLECTNEIKFLKSKLKIILDV